MPMRPGTARRHLKDVLSAIDKVQADLPNGTLRVTNNAMDQARECLNYAVADFKLLMLAETAQRRPPLME